jgi:hypothetical protein
MTFDVLYNAGIESYVEERWSECADYMLKAIKDHKTFQENLIDCRLKCESDTGTIPNYLDYDDLEARRTEKELAFFELALTRSNCIRRCKKEKLSGRTDSIDAEIMAEFGKLQPYDYLQICSYKVG